MTDQPRRIAFVYPYIAHYREPIFRHLANSEALEVDILAGSDANIQIKLLARSNYTEDPLPWIPLRNRWFGALLWQRGLMPSLRRVNYDAVVFFGSAHYLSTWVAALLMRLRGRDVFMWGHGLLAPESGPHGLTREAFYHLAKGHFIYSSRSIELMKQRRLLRNKEYHQINNSLDFDEHMRTRQTASETPSPYPKVDIAMVYIGRLTKRKRIDLAIEAVRRLSDQGKSATLWIAGDGEDRPRLEETAKSLEVEDAINFIGETYDEHKIAVLLHHADICVSPGHIGLTAVHAMTYGTPVITHDNLDRHAPEFETIVPRETGMLFIEGSVQSLTESILKMYEVHDREAVRQRCINRVADSYNPRFQLRVFERALGE